VSRAKVLLLPPLLPVLLLGPCRLVGCAQRASVPCCVLLAPSFEATVRLPANRVLPVAVARAGTALAIARLGRF